MAPRRVWFLCVLKDISLGYLSVPRPAIVWPKVIYDTAQNADHLIGATGSAPRGGVASVVVSKLHVFRCLPVVMSDDTRSEGMSGAAVVSYGDTMVCAIAEGVYFPGNPGFEVGCINGRRTNQKGAYAKGGSQFREFRHEEITSYVLGFVYVIDLVAASRKELLCIGVKVRGGGIDGKLWKSL